MCSSQGTPEAPVQSLLTIALRRALLNAKGKRRRWVLIKLIFGDELKKFAKNGEITSQSLADGLIHFREAEPTTSELMAQMIYEDFVKNR
jgi:hypothetical protein